MKRALVLLLALSALPAAPAAWPQEAAPPPEAARLWNEMTREQRAEMMRRYEQFKALSAAEQEALRDRHRLLDQARRRVLEELPAPEARRLGGLDERERRRALNQPVKEYLARARSEVLEQAGLEPGAPEGGTFRHLRKAVQARALAELLELEEQGVLAPGEAERLFTLPAWQMKQELAALRKRHVLGRPPRAFLALPEAERERLRALPPERFFDELEQLKGPRPPAPKRRPPRLLDDVLHDRPPPLAEAELLRGLTPEQRGALEGVQGKERRRKAHRFLVENARKALAARHQDARILERLLDPPPGGPPEARAEARDAVDRALLRLIEGCRLPPPGARMDGGGRSPPAPPPQGKPHRLY